MKYQLMATSPSLGARFSVSSMDNCSLMAPEEYETLKSTTIHSSRTGRQTYKTSITNRTVWPDYLEDALLQALFSYRPASTKAPRTQLRRFPNRNRYISQYIFSATGVKRSAKQVGSRLQQLRETCTDPTIYDLIVNKNISPATPPEEDLSGDPSAPFTPPIANDIYTVSESELLTIPHYLHQDRFSPLYIPDQPAFELLSTSNRPTYDQSCPALYYAPISCDEPQLPPEFPNIPFEVPHHHVNLKKSLDPLLYHPTPCYPFPIFPPPIACYAPQIEDDRSSLLAGAVHPFP